MPQMRHVGSPSKGNVVEVRPSRKFGGAWLAFESEAVQPAFTGRYARQHAIDYAKQRFGGGAGEVRVFTESGDAIAETFAINGRDLYPHAS